MIRQECYSKEWIQKVLSNHYPNDCPNFAFHPPKRIIIGLKPANCSLGTYSRFNKVRLDSKNPVQRTLEFRTGLELYRVIEFWRLKMVERLYVSARRRLFRTSAGTAPPSTEEACIGRGHGRDCVPDTSFCCRYRRRGSP